MDIIAQEDLIEFFVTIWINPWTGEAMNHCYLLSALAEVGSHHKCTHSGPGAYPQIFQFKFTSGIICCLSVSIISLAGCHRYIWQVTESPQAGSDICNNIKKNSSDCKYFSLYKHTGTAIGWFTLEGNSFNISYWIAYIRRITNLLLQFAITQHCLNYASNYASVNAAESIYSTH